MSSLSFTLSVSLSLTAWLCMTLLLNLRRKGTERERIYTSVQRSMWSLSIDIGFLHLACYSVHVIFYLFTFFCVCYVLFSYLINVYWLCECVCARVWRTCACVNIVNEWEELLRKRRRNSIKSPLYFWKKLPF